jgi:hypothetical protein
VTCYSCHRGSLKPETTPMIGGEVARGTAPEVETLASGSPTVDQIIGNSIRALGGAAAIRKITSRVATGTTSMGGRSIRVEVYDQYPGKRTVVRHMPAGDSITVLNGQQGWSSAPGRPTRDMHGADLDAARMDANLQFPLHLQREFDKLSVEYRERVGGQKAYVVSGMRVGLPPVKFYFSEQSGLLVRLVRYVESPLGRNPTRVDYGDYRKSDGVMIPFRRTVATPEGRATIQLEQVRQNVPIPAARFAKPLPSDREQK